MTRILCRVIAHLVTPISLAEITYITARDFVRVIAAITWLLLAYHYAANHDAQFSARYVAYFDATFGVRNMRFRIGDFMARYSRYNAGSFDPPLLRIWQGIAPRHYFNNFSFR